MCDFIHPETSHYFGFKGEVFTVCIKCLMFSSGCASKKPLLIENAPSLQNIRNFDNISPLNMSYDGVDSISKENFIRKKSS